MENSLRLPQRQLARRQGDYGFDEPIWPILFLLLGVAFLLVGWFSFTAFARPVLGLLALALAIVCLFNAASYVYTTRRGKIEVWADILTGLQLRGDEQLLDLGCGRGAVLLMAASLLPHGIATGIDVWNANEQSGNALEVTERNANKEGVAGRVQLRTADMQKLPFPDATFDVVVSSLAIHNIRSSAGRMRAISEAARVLKPGGQLVIADLLETRRYYRRLSDLGMATESPRSLGWRFWYGGPWVATWLVRARKPS